jgi:hypothetical protein
MTRQRVLEPRDGDSGDAYDVPGDGSHMSGFRW